MTETRRCDQCGKHLITHRRGARFCGDECKNAWHNKHRRSQSTTGKRFTPAEGGVGARGGNVRSVDEARQLQTESKALDRWRLVMEEQIHRTLLGTGRFHVDDLDCLDLPPEAFEVRGTLVNAVRRTGVMQSTNITRKVAHKAANARKAPIYEITAKGRERLPTLVGSSCDAFGGSHIAAGPGEKQKSVGVDVDHHGDGEGALSIGVDAPAVGVDPGDSTIGAGQLTDKRDQGRPSLSSSPAGTDASDSLIQLDEAKPKPRNAIFDDDWETGEAA